MRSDMFKQIHMFPTYVYIPSVALLDGEKGGGVIL